MCVPCPTGETTCCRKVWGQCVCRKPLFKNCCKDMPDDLCAAKKKACRAALEKSRHWSSSQDTTQLAAGQRAWARG